MSTRYSYAMTMAFLASAALLTAGCSSKSETGQTPGQSAQQQNAPAWSLTLKSNCLADADTQCVAKYGFTVDADGKYQVGPGPQGQIRKGVLQDAEFAAIKAKVEAAGQASATVAAESHEEDFAHHANDTLTLTKAHSDGKTLLRNEGADFYTVLSDAEASHALHTAIRDLAISYYRVPFGDECGDAADKFATAAAATQACQTDLDCVYVRPFDRDFDVIPPGSNEALLTEDCLAPKPLLVANKLTIQSAAKDLSAQYSATRDACGSEFAINNLGWNNLGGRSCEYQQKMTAVPPTCEQHVCVAHLQ